MTDASGPGMVPLEQFVEARLYENTPAVNAAAVAAHRKVLKAHRAARFGTMHHAGLQVAVKALAGIWADHADYDPAWR